MKKAVVLLSGGQDSTTALYWAKRRFDEVHALSFTYGQRHSVEVDAAAQIGRMAGCATHAVVNAPMVQLGAQSALLQALTPLTAGGGLKDDEAPDGLPSSFVPGRNLLFFAMAGVRAAALKADAIVTGVCQTDYSGYPDCREDFVNVMAAAINLAMPDELRTIDIEAPLMHLSKAATVKLGHDLGSECWTALGLTVTCYEGHRPGCGVCPACTLRRRGFEAMGLEDPAVARWGQQEGRHDPKVKTPTIPGDA
jgi:7-cyano-7-deazaguanine synthase